MILWHFTRCGEFSEGFNSLSIKWKYTHVEIIYIVMYIGLYSYMYWVV